MDSWEWKVRNLKWGKEEILKIFYYKGMYMIIFMHYSKSYIKLHINVLKNKHFFKFYFDLFEVGFFLVHVFLCRVFRLVVPGFTL